MSLKEGTPRIARATPRIASNPVKVVDGFYLSRPWRDARALAILLSGGICARCGKVIGGRIYVDHKIELSDGGQPLSQENLEVMHGSCHTQKTIERRAERMRS